MDIESLKATFEALTEYAILLIDILAFVTILAGTIQAFITGAAAAFRGAGGPALRYIWLRYSRWLVAGLTFQLAADIIESAISPSWEEIGKLAAIAVIRTFLNYFLERDVSEVRDLRREDKESHATEA